MKITSRTKLNSGARIPYFGLGVWKMAEGKETYEAVLHALKVGYRHIDTAQYYANEASVGKAIKKSGIPRKNIFVTSKLAISNFGYDSTLKTFNESLDRFGFDYLDLFLLHFPVNGLRLESWKALEEIYKSGKSKAIGVSNFTIDHLKELLKNSDVVPAVNQIEFSPYLYQKELHSYCQKKNIQLEAYSPLTQGNMLEDSKLIAIAKKYNKSSAQILIRWALQHEVVVIPKSSNFKRIEENADVFDFKISDSDMKEMDSFNQNKHFSWDPTNEKQVKTFSSLVVRKLSKIAQKTRKK